MPTASDNNSEAPKPKSRRSARHAIEFRCRSADEKQKIVLLAEAANADVSEYCRAKALNQKPQSLPSATGERKLLIEALGQLGKIGSNVNQLARAVNMGRNLPEAAAIIEAMQEVERCGAAIREELFKSKP